MRLVIFIVNHFVQIGTFGKAIVNLLKMDRYVLGICTPLSF
jgi:hypothetical protein